MTEQKEPELEVSDEYKIKQEKEGLFDAYQGISPEFPDCPYYMTGYNKVK
jgi:hypothetical protein